MRALLIAALAASALLTPGSAAAAACSWASAELPLPEGTNFSAITGAADDGSHVLGVGVTPAWQDVALVWHNGSVRSVPLEPGQFPNDVNAAGTVLINSSAGHALRGGAELNPLPGNNSAWAAAINSAGAAVGRSGSRMVIWPADSPVPRTVSGTDDGAGWTVAGIDDQGRVVGLSAGDGWSGSVGVEWDLQGNVVRTLTSSTEATDVTSSGDVLGLPSGVWRANGEIEQLPATNTYAEFSDSGSLFGAHYHEGTYTPVEVHCA